MKFIIFVGILLWVFMSSNEVKPMDSISDDEIEDLVDYYIDKNKEEHALKNAKISVKNTEENSTKENSTKEHSLKVSY